MNNDSTQDQIIQIKSEIIEIAKKMIESKIDLIQGCHKITSLQYKLKNNDKIFLFFRGIASETDDIPFGQERDTWASESLARLDAETEKYVTKIRSQILDACTQVIETLSKQEDILG